MGMLGGSIRLFNFRGIPVTISVFGLIFIAIFWVLPSASAYQGTGGLVIGVGLGIGVIFSIIVHELSHAITGMIFGARVISIQLDMLGGATYFASRPLSYLKDTFVSLAGPISNLVLWKVCDFLSTNLLQSRQSFELVVILYGMSQLNLFLAVFNALPGFPMDGGQAVNSFAMWVTRNARFAAGLTMVMGLLVAGYIVLDTVLIKKSFVSQASLGPYFIIYIAILIAFSSINLYAQARPRSAETRLTPRQQAARQEQQASQQARSHPGHDAYEAGRNYLLSREYDKAVASFNQAIQVEPREMSYLDYRAYTYAQMGNYGQAIADYNELLEKNPRRADFFSARAQAYKAIGNLDAARYDVAQALSINPMENQAVQLQNELNRLVR